MDVVVIIFVLGALAILIFKKQPKSIVYYITIMDMFFRILSFISSNIPIKVISNFINKYIPTSVNNIVESYTSGIFTTVLLWLLVVVYIIFLVSTVKIFLKKSKK